MSLTSFLKRIANAPIYSSPWGAEKPDQLAELSFDGPRQTELPDPSKFPWKANDHAITLTIRSRKSYSRYEITLRRTETGLAMDCDCPAGLKDMACKHRIALIRADPAAFDADPAALAAAADRIQASGLPQALEAYETALAENEKQLKKLQRAQKRMKMSFAKTLEDGI